MTYLMKFEQQDGRRKSFFFSLRPNGCIYGDDDGELLCFLRWKEYDGCVCKDGGHAVVGEKRICWTRAA